MPIALKRPGRLAIERDGRILVVDPADGSAVRTVLEGTDYSVPRWSPDGRSLLFARGRGPTAELYVMAAGGGPARRLTANHRPERSAVWSPTGDRVAYVVPRTDDARAFDSPSQSTEIWTVDLATGADRKVADGFDPAWFPDGRALVYATNGPRDERGPRDNGLRLVNPDGQGDRPLIGMADLPTDLLSSFGLPFKPATLRVRSPAWSPDGRSLAASADGHTSLVYTFDGRGQGLRPWAVAFDGGVGQVHWSSDGGRLAIESQPATGVSVVVIVDLASGRQTTIGGPEIGFQAASPTWSPDGRGLALVVTNLPGREDRTRTTALRLYAPDGTETAQLIAEGGLANPDWGPAP